MEDLNVSASDSGSAAQDLDILTTVNSEVPCDDDVVILKPTPAADPMTMSGLFSRDLDPQGDDTETMSSSNVSQSGGDTFSGCGMMDSFILQPDDLSAPDVDDDDVGQSSSSLPALESRKNVLVECGMTDSFMQLNNGSTVTGAETHGPVEEGVLIDFGQLQPVTLSSSSNENTDHGLDSSQAAPFSEDPGRSQEALNKTCHVTEDSVSDDIRPAEEGNYLSDQPTDTGSTPAANSTTIPGGIDLLIQSAPPPTHPYHEESRGSGYNPFADDTNDQQECTTMSNPFEMEPLQVSKEEQKPKTDEGAADEQEDEDEEEEEEEEISQRSLEQTESEVDSNKIMAPLPPVTCTEAPTDVEVVLESPSMEKEAENTDETATETSAADSVAPRIDLVQTEDDDHDNPESSASMEDVVAERDPEVTEVAIVDVDAADSDVTSFQENDVIEQSSATDVQKPLADFPNQGLDKEVAEPQQQQQQEQQQQTPLPPHQPESDPPAEGPTTKPVATVVPQPIPETKPEEPEKKKPDNKTTTSKFPQKSPQKAAPAKIQSSSPKLSSSTGTTAKTATTPSARQRPTSASLSSTGSRPSSAKKDEKPKPATTKTTSTPRADTAPSSRTRRENKVQPSQAQTENRRGGQKSEVNKATPSRTSSARASTSTPASNTSPAGQGKTVPAASQTSSAAAPAKGRMISSPRKPTGSASKASTVSAPVGSPRSTRATSGTGSLEKPAQSPGAANVMKTTTKKTDVSRPLSGAASKDKVDHKARPSSAKTDNKKPELGAAKSRVSSLDKAKSSPAGGDRKIDCKKSDWRSQSKVSPVDKTKQKPGLAARKARGGCDVWKHVQTVGEKKTEDKEKATADVAAQDSTQAVEGHN